MIYYSHVFKRPEPVQLDYSAPSLGLVEYLFCQSYLTGGIFRQFVYTIFASSEQLIHHAISSQLSYNHQSSILQSSPVITSHFIISYHTNLIIYPPHLFIYSHHIILASYHIILISHYSLPYSPSCYSLSTSFLTYPFLYISYPPIRILPPSYHTYYSYSHFSFHLLYSLTFSSPLISPLLTHSPSFPLLSFVSIHIPFHITYIHSFSNLSVRINLLSTPIPDHFHTTLTPYTFHIFSHNNNTQ